MTFVVKHPSKWIIKIDDAPYPYFNYAPFVPVNDNMFEPFDIHKYKGLVLAATGKSIEEIIEEQGEF